MSSEATSYLRARAELLGGHEQRLVNPSPYIRRPPNEVSKNTVRWNPSRSRRTRILSRTRLCQTPIDAICINQTDILEKGVQVAHMGDTFKQADYDLIWIGMHDDSSRFVATKLCDFQDYLTKRNTSVFILTS
jgi:hypothetical protein